MDCSAEMLTLFRAELLLCKVGPGQTLATLTQGMLRADYAQAFLLAAHGLGADCFNINLPAMQGRASTGRSALAQSRSALAALKSADIVIDLVGLLFSAEQNQLMAAGTRILMVLEPFNVLRDLLPTAELRARVEAAERRLSRAKTLHVVSESGTDIHYDLNTYPVLSEYGYTDQPGRWDHWPSGMVITSGDDTGVNGTIVLMPGDIWQGFRRYIQTKVTFTVRDGYVADIAGDGFDAELIRTYLKSFDDKRAYAMSHIGWGLNQHALWHHLADTPTREAEIGMHGISFYGNVLVSLGPNSEVGGSNDTQCHVDIPMRNCSLFLDGEPMVLGGEVIPEDMRVVPTATQRIPLVLS